MKRRSISIMKQNIKRLLPVSIVIGITIIVSIFLYHKVMDREEERCWQILSDSAKTISAEIQMKFQDNITTLGLAANAMVQENKLEPEQISSVHLDAFAKNTIFSRIDVIYPDNTILYEDGHLKHLRQDLDFNAIAALGEHISHRLTDSETGNESFYYYMPVIKSGEIKAILTGVIDTTVLADVFQISFYNGHAAICLVDSADGNYALDTRYSTLGNAYDMPGPALLKGYETIDLKSEVKSLETGVIAFESSINGKDNYMHYSPVGMFDWELLVIAQEDVVFSSLLYLKKLMILAGIIEFLLLGLYIAWNFYTVEQLAKSEKRAQEQLKNSNTLIQCVTELSSDKDINISIQNLLGIITQYFDSDRTYIFELNSEKTMLRNTYEYVKGGVSVQIDNLQEVPITVLPKWMESFLKFKPYYISNLEQERGFESYNMLKEQDVNRLIAVPLGKRGDVIGFVGVDNPRQFYNDATLLSSIQFFLTNSLATKKQQEQLQYMSYRDMLTFLFNRNKYIEVLDSHQGKILENVGTAYIDLNGLKQINDSQGHEAGDAFIQNAARVLSRVFPDKVYRIGGDEFVIIQSSIEELEFHNRINRLQEYMKQDQISISIGFLWKASCENLEDMLKEADHRMYEAKKAYYQTADRRTHNH